VTPAGSGLPSPGTVAPMCHIGRCSTAKLRTPSGAVTGDGKNTVSLLWNNPRSVSSSSTYSNVTGPSRRQLLRSSLTATAVRGPSGP
jgi:hypothetical protein